MIELGFLILGVILLVLAFIPILRDRIEQDTDDPQRCDMDLVMRGREDIYDVATMCVQVRVLNAMPYESRKELYESRLSEKILRGIREQNLLQFRYDPDDMLLYAEIKILVQKNTNNNEKQ